MRILAFGFMFICIPAMAESLGIVIMQNTTLDSGAGGPMGVYKYSTPAQCQEGMKRLASNINKSKGKKISSMEFTYSCQHYFSIPGNKNVVALDFIRGVDYGTRKTVVMIVGYSEFYDDMEQCNAGGFSGEDFKRYWSLRIGRPIESAVSFQYRFGARSCQEID